MSLVSRFLKKIKKKGQPSNNIIQSKEDINKLGQDYLKKAKGLAAQKKYFEALEELELGYNYIPNDEELRNLMDRVLYKIIQPLINDKKAAKAKEILLKYSHIDKGDATQSTLNNLSWACYSNREYAEALEYSLKGLELDNTDFYLYSNKGNALLGLNRYEEAIETFELAIKYAPEDFTIPLYGKGASLFNLERYEECEKVFKKYLQFKDNEDAYGYLIESFNSQGKHKEKIDFIDSILEKCYKDPWYHYKKGCSLTALSSYHAAMECFDEAIFLDKNYVGAYYSKCRIYCRFRIYDGAFEMLKKTLELDEGYKDFALEDGYLEEFVQFSEVKALLGGELDERKEA
ncbi:MAG: tetratricopeptide repeat protein [Bacillota bacterium]|nr:tetratricopeptide repeat protein [Bacillota bacterium]